MVSFGALITKNPEKGKVTDLLRFVKSFNDRLTGIQDFGKNPFKGKGLKAHLQEEDNQILLTLDIEPIYPKIYVFGFLLLCAGFLWAPLFWIGSIFLLPAFFWTKYFYFIMLWLSLKKQVKGFKIKLLENEEVIRRCVYHGSARGL